MRLNVRLDGAISDLHKRFCQKILAQWLYLRESMMKICVRDSKKMQDAVSGNFNLNSKDLKVCQVSFPFGAQKKLGISRSWVFWRMTKIPTFWRTCVRALCGDLSGILLIPSCQGICKSRNVVWQKQIMSFGNGEHDITIIAYNCIPLRRFYWLHTGRQHTSQCACSRTGRQLFPWFFSVTWNGSMTWINDMNLSQCHHHHRFPSQLETQSGISYALSV